MFRKASASPLARQIADTLRKEDGWAIGNFGASHESGVSVRAHNEYAVSLEWKGAALPVLSLSRADRRLIWGAYREVSARAVQQLISGERTSDNATASGISRATAPAELGNSGTPTNTSTHTGDQPL